MVSYTATALPHSAATVRSVVGPIIVWLFVIAVGWAAIEKYEFATVEPSPRGLAERWPADTSLLRHGDRATLVIFLHPKCPCSRATLGELERLLLDVDEQVVGTPDVLVIAPVPPAASDQWHDTETVRRAGRLAGARVFVDRGGIEAAQFGATTSGMVMLFGEAGDRQYAGGITVSRGHEGDNLGRNLITRILRGRCTNGGVLPAFGCRLCLPENGGSATLLPTSITAAKGAADRPSAIIDNSQRT